MVNGYTAPLPSFVPVALLCAKRKFWRLGYDALHMPVRLLARGMAYSWCVQFWRWHARRLYALSGLL